MVQLAERAAAIYAHGALGRIDADAAHERQVDDQAAFARPQTGAVVPAAADGHEQFLLAPEVDGGDDIGHIGAAGNERRALVDHDVVHGPRLIVPLVG